MRQAAALIGGAVETNQTLRREARAIPRREPAPFEDKVDIRAPTPAPAPAEGAEAKPAPEPEAPKKPAEIRQLSLTGQPEAERPAAPAGRGNLVDVDA